MKYIKVYKILFFLLGFLSLIEGFKYNLGGIKVYPMDLIFYSLFIILIITSTWKLRIKQQSKSVLLLLLLTLLLSINVLIPLIDEASNEYLVRSFKYSIKFIFLFIFFFLLFSQELKIQNTYIKYLIKGFKISIITHALYSILVLIYWYGFSVDFHTKFLNYLGVTEESVGHVLLNFVYRPIIRVSGIHWDPAYFGLLGMIFILYLFIVKMNKRTKYVLIVLVFVPWIFTFSRTSIVAGIFSIFTFLFILFPSKSIYKKTFKWILIISIFFAISQSLITLDSDSTVSTIFQNRVETKSEGSERHLYYPYYVLQTLSEDPFHFLFGYGNRNSGRAFQYTNVELPGWDVNTKQEFDIETDLFKILATQGIVGFIIYLLFIYYLIKGLKARNKFIIDLNNDNLFLLIIMLNLFFGGLFYVFNDSKWVWFAIFAIILSINNPINEDIYKREIS